jgi:hypothetical protein
MSDDLHPPIPAPTVVTLVDQINELTIEVTILRESIVTAAEWDNQARQERQQILDAALTSAGTWLRLLVGVNVLLLLLVLVLLIRFAGV